MAKNFSKKESIEEGRARMAKKKLSPKAAARRAKNIAYNVKTGVAKPLKKAEKVKPATKVKKRRVAKKKVMPKSPPRTNVKAGVAKAARTAAVVKGRKRRTKAISKGNITATVKKGLKGKDVETLRAAAMKAGLKKRKRYSKK